MNVNDKWTALRALDVERRISFVMGDGEETEEVKGTTSVAKKIAHEAFIAGYKQARREFLGERVKGHSKTCAINNTPSPYDCDCKKGS